MAGPYVRRYAPKGSPVEFRLRLHMIEAPSGCWIWTGARQKSGHGKIGIDGRTLCAHRVAYETWVGPIPAGLHLDHLCRRPACIKPLHLQPVTARTNILRGTTPAARSRRSPICLRGHSYAKFGVVYSGKRKCSECSRAYSRARRAALASAA